MKPELSLQCRSKHRNLPTAEQFQRWLELVLADSAARRSVTVCLVDTEESRQLNLRYRAQDKPTNVLSFPSDLPDRVLKELDLVPLGDLVICAPKVLAEAREQGKQQEHHWAHLTIHGVLHLLGYDHQNERQALEMESLETRLMEELGFPNPHLEINP